MHCPSGFDETEENCAHVFVPILYMYGVAAISFLIFVFVVIVIVQRLRAGTAVPPSGSIVTTSGTNGGLLYGHQEESITNLAKMSQSHSGPVNGSATLMSSLDLLNHEEGS